jgi:hypothetical protein
MANDPPEYWLRSPESGPLLTCEVLSDVEHVVLDPACLGTDRHSIIVESHAYVLVMSQACDIEWHIDARQKLAGLGSAPADRGQRQEWSVKQRRHQAQLMDGILLCEAKPYGVQEADPGLNASDLRHVEKNQLARYYALRACPPAADGYAEEIPQLLVDFKRFFTIPCDELYARLLLAPGISGRARRRASLASPYLEDAVSRFYNYQARVALPGVGRPDA